MSTEELLVVLVTAPPDEAPDLARELVRRRLVACANLIDPIRSCFRWEGEVADEPEALLVLKTRADAFDALQRAVVELHSYDVPEVIAVGVDRALDAYAQWVAAEVAGPP